MDKTQAAAGQNGKRGTGRPALLSAMHVEVLREFVKTHRRGSLEDATRDLRERCGVDVCSKTVHKALQAAGISRVKPARLTVGDENGPAGRTRRYGYTSLHRRETTQGEYATCLTDAEWARVADLFERPAGSRGMPARLARRTLVNACCYVLRTGCSWRLLPTSLPARPAVYKSFSRWALKGVFEVMQDRLRAQWRERLQRDPLPSAAVLDSQSTRISPQGGECGFDAGKKVKGRKRHLVVDTLGLLLAVTAASASVQDRDGAVAVVAQACAKLPPRLCPPASSCSQSAGSSSAPTPGTSVAGVWSCPRPQHPDRHCLGLVRPGAYLRQQTCGLNLICLRPLSLTVSYK